VLALLLLAAALGLDNLAAATGIGVTGVSGGTRVRIAVVFGLFEAGMPVLGLVLGHGLADSLGQAARWLGGTVLIAFGAAGLAKAWRQRNSPERTGHQPAGHQRIGRLLLAGLVLSGDNLAAGFALGAYHTSVAVAVAAAVFGVVSVGMSLIGLELGARIGAAAGERSELIACALLIVVGAVIAAGGL
jgi:manganese efflux pump family protein